MSSGEIDPLLHHREDFQRWQTGLAVCAGFVPLRQGGVTRAPGTTYRGTTKSSAVARRVPFIFAQNDAVELEFTDLTMRVWRYGSLVMDGASPYELTTPFAEADLPNITWAQDADVMYLADGRNPLQQLSRAALDDWTIADAALEAGPFQAQNLDEAKTVQCVITASSIVAPWVSGESLTIGDKRSYGLAVYEYRGTGATEGSATDGVVGTSPPAHTSGTVGYLVSGSDYAFWLHDASSDPSDITSVDLAGTGDIFTSDHVGALLMLAPEDWTQIAIWVGNATVAAGELIRFDGNVYQVGALSGGVPQFTSGTVNTGTNPPVHDEGTVRTTASSPTVYRHVSTETGIVRITSVTDANTAAADVVRAVPQPCFDDPSYRWSIGAWNDLYDHPRLLAWFEQRLFAAGDDSAPRTVYASEQGAFRSFLPGAFATSSFTYDIGGAGSRNAITWLIEGKRGVYIGSQGEVRRGYSETGEPIGPETFKVQVVSRVGAAPILPVTPLGWPIYISRDGKRLIEVRFDLRAAGFDEMAPLDLSLPSQHLGAPGFEQIVWQTGAIERGWLRRGDGSLAVLIYDPDQDVLGWAPVTVAGGVVEDMCVTPSSDGARDVVTLTVRRTLDGATVRAVEEMADNTDVLQGAAPLADAHHAFCAVVETADPATDSFTAPHLAGETVAAWTDQGGFENIEVAADGTLSLGLPVTQAVIGLLDETHQCRTLPMRAAAVDGDSRGRKRQLRNGSALMATATAGGTVRTVERNTGEDWHQGDSQILFDVPLLDPLPVDRSGILPLTVTSGWADEVALQWEPAGLAPLTVTGVVANIDEVEA